jgi:hypothetical protein
MSDTIVKALIIGYEPDEEGHYIHPIEFEREDLLGAMYAAISCSLVQAVDIPSIKASLWMDEEYLYTKDGTQFNQIATAMHNEGNPGPDHPIFGNCILTGLPDDEGWTTSVPQEAVVAMEAMDAAMAAITSVFGQLENMRII